MQSTFNRRQAMSVVGATAAGLAFSAAPNSARSATASGISAQQFSFSLNTSTIRAAKLTVPELVDLVAEAGYDGIELWVRDVQMFQQQGGNLRDLKKRANDHGLEVVNMIGFANWIVDDEARRSKGMDDMKRDMELAERVGCKRIAAPPAGGNRQAIDLADAARRYRALLELGEDQGVTPHLELWGSSATLSRLGELAYVAMEAGHPQARVLPDVYHIYKGGSSFEGLRMFSGAAIGLFHINDYPADPPREQAKDADRVFPGDGIAPLDDILQILQAIGYAGHLSLELFNPEYWSRDPKQVAREGLAKMKQSVRAALSS